MNRSQPSPLAKIAPAVLAIALLAIALLALPAGAGAATHFQHESFKAFEKQLSAGQIHAATFNKKAHSLHLSLNDGRHMLVSYPSHEEPQLAAKLRAKGVPVAVEKRKVATKAVHHTLRYIAGGIVVIVIVVVAAVLLVDRRRKLGAAAGAGAAPATSSGDSG
jgi:hypothetical protein